MKEIKKLLSVIPENRRVFWKAMYAYTSWGVYPIVNVYMFTRITFAIEQGDEALLINLIIIYLILIAIVWIWSYSARYHGWTEIVGEYSKILHKKYMNEFVYLDNVGYEKIGTGKFISIIEKGISNRGTILDYSFGQVTALLLTLAYVIYVLGILGINYMVVFLILLFLIVLFSISMNQSMLIARRDRVTAKNSYVRYLVKIIMSKYETMQVGLRKQDIDKLDQEMNHAIQANRNMQPYAQLFFWTPALLISILKIAILFILGVGVIKQTSSYTELVAAGTGLGLLENLMGRRLKYYKDSTKDFDLVKRMRDTFDDVGMIEGYESGEHFNYNMGNIAIQDIVYAYDAQTEVFDDLSLKIQGGKKTALVGISGGGKSTLIKLIAGYLRPDSGSIIVDGQDLEDVSLKSYYRHIGYLTQEPSVFDGTVMENLTYAIDGEVDESILDQAIKNAKCEFVYDFPDGLETEIGERGIRLSGGQRQRLAIAKIFLKDPEIIILDEPTSALDSFSEEAITEAMHKLFEGRTVIIIAHRLQTVKAADDIILLEDGKVVERGAHDELVDQGGQYAKMLELQSGF